MDKILNTTEELILWQLVYCLWCHTFGHSAMCTVMFNMSSLSCRFSRDSADPKINRLFSLAVRKESDKRNPTWSNCVEARKVALLCMTNSFPCLTSSDPDRSSIDNPGTFPRPCFKLCYVVRSTISRSRMHVLPVSVRYRAVSDQNGRNCRVGFYAKARVPPRLSLVFQATYTLTSLYPLLITSSMLLFDFLIENCGARDQTDQTESLPGITGEASARASPGGESGRAGRARNTWARATL